MDSDSTGLLGVGNAPLSWGVFEGDDERNLPWSVVLDEIAQAGYRRLELGPIGYLPEDPEVLADELARRDLSLVAGFVYEHMHAPAQRDVVVVNTRRVGRMLAALGARYLVVIDRMVPERQRTAGRSDAAQRLSVGAASTMFETIATVTDIAAEEFGLRAVLHPHCGTHIEFGDEIDQALAALPSEKIGLCIDTGHSAVAGMQAADLVSRYADRVEYLHFKDVDARALQRMHDEGLEFEEALGVGLFCPLGEGIVDFLALRERLSQIGCDGLATVEQDPDPRTAVHSGLAAASASIEFLRDVGLARKEPDALGHAGPTAELHRSKGRGGC